MVSARLPLLDSHPFLVYIMSFNDLERGEASQPLLRGGAGTAVHYEQERDADEQTKTRHSLRSRTRYLSNCSRSRAMYREFNGWSISWGDKRMVLLFGTACKCAHSRCLAAQRPWIGNRESGGTLAVLMTGTT